MTISFGYENPYENLSIDQKIQILIEYFVDNQIVAQFPKKPIKGKLKDSSPIKIIEFERYYNYIQRLKIIKENRIKEQQKINLKYKEDIAKYNKTISHLKHIYQTRENFNKLLNIALNNSFKILYGKPILQKPYVKNGKLYAKVVSKSIYGYNYKLEQIIKIDNINKKDFKYFIEFYRKAKVFVLFDYNFDTKILKYKGVNILFQKKHYDGIFITKPLEYNITIKLDETIFKLIKKGQNGKKTS